MNKDERGNNASFFLHAGHGQLDQFKKNSVYKGEVFDEGLWKYSRRPNYFFEWILWIGYCMLALSASWGWLGIISSLLMLYLL